MVGQHVTTKPPHKRKFNAFGARRPGSFVKLDHGLLGSEAWQHLTPRACKLYVAVRARFNGMNNSYISYSIREAVKLLNCNPNTACACFDELTDKGFLKCARESTFTLKTKEARLWTITTEKIGDDSPTRDFKHWQYNQSQRKDKTDDEPRRTTSLGPCARPLRPR